MVDFIVNLFVEIADFFIAFWVDNGLAKAMEKLQSLSQPMVESNHSTYSSCTETDKDCKM